MIEVERLCYQYGDITAVDDVSFSIKKGQIVGLLGHNGAGKTTIMKMLTGFLEPSSGTILIEGLSMSQQRTAIQHKIGYLPENCPLYPEMTVIDYLNYIANLRGFDKQQSKICVSKAIFQTALATKATETISVLSRGYRQRVGVAAAILSTPEILILDEPTNGLDPTQIQHMRTLITNLSATTTVILSTHILHEVQAICDHVLILRNAKLALNSSLKELQKSRQLTLICNSNLDVLRDHIGDYPKLKLVENSSLDEGIFEYILQCNDDEYFNALIPELVRSLTRNNIDIYTIKPIQQDLEAVFKKINVITKQNAGGITHAA